MIAGNSIDNNYQSDVDFQPSLCLVDALTFKVSNCPLCSYSHSYS